MGIFGRKPTPDYGFQLDLLRDELWRRQDSQGRRLGTIETVAGVLIGGAALVSSIISVLPSSLPLRLGLICGLFSALFGLLALIPRKIHELSPRFMRGKLRGRTAQQARIWHTDHLIAQIERRETLIQKRFALTRVGLVFLAATVVFISFAIATGEVIR